MPFSSFLIAHQTHTNPGPLLVATSSVATMLKQILAKIPRKSLKSDPKDSSLSNSINNPTSSGNGVQFTNSCNVIANRLNVVKRMSSAIFPANIVAGGESIAPHVCFKDVSNGEKQGLFLSKLNLCCSVYDFSDPDKNSAEKDLKRQVLSELNDFVTSGSVKCTESAIAAVCKMCAINLFRDFPPKYPSQSARGEGDDEEPLFDPAWYHLQLVYDLFLQFISLSSLDPKVAKKYIHHSFILKLLNLFDSEDPRERECLKSVLHRLYGKFMMHRPFIRNAVSNIFYGFVFETQRHNGISELLEVFGSVISGFALPLKEEHKLFFSRALIPLHKPKSLGVYHQQLAYCVVQFVEKDQNLGSIVIEKLLKYWPVKNSQKELMFISEIEELLELINISEFQKIMVPLFRRLGYCLNSSHFQVAERAHLLWNNDNILNLVMHNKDVIMPIVVSALERNSQSHWNKAILNLTQNVRKVITEMDEELVCACQSKLEEEKSLSNVVAERRRLTWEHLDVIAASNISALTKPASCVVSC
ncbi:serine/threonine protein phosphatase 2A 57 kDa regulatory subunit B' kappa isoform-like [Ipomoea triloba]|uniref:serine/threonine protein phosphatase 2A 57 kDa regulatory subunit B' kappa isoform-like n=1 Tax=Ipomoea triloba TaxID=35885 RepID=UPI00125E4B0C|nr:serine/threonine protein phosphatase 2A 57 kDa regulatory subunit B' kappa isoform-like [Ipomoea triloba]